MINATLCIVVTVFCALLAVAASASAECAWVLWGVSGKTDPERPLIDMQVSFIPSRWMPIRSYATLQSCKVNQDETETGEMNKMLRRSKDKEGLIDAYLYRCLPDTVDPRGPKGK